MHRRTQIRCLAASCGAALALAALAGGCGGQGGYTREGSSLAQQRMAALKSATEWDMGRQAFLAGDLDKAMGKVETSIALNDSVPKSHVLRARILIEKGNLGEAMQSLRVAEAIDPNDIEAQYYLGIVYERLSRREDALTHFRAAADLDPHSPQFAVSAAEMLIDLGRIDEAREYLQGLAAAEHNAGVRQALGHIAMISGDPETAVSMFNAARLLAPDDGAIMEDLVRAQMEVGEFAQAEYNLSRLMRDPDNRGRRDLKHMRAQCLLNVNRPVEARAIYTELTAGDSGHADVDAWIGLGLVAFRLSDDRNLRRAAARAVALAPRRAEGHALWAMHHRRSGRFEEAMHHIEMAIERQPEDELIRRFRTAIVSEARAQGFAAVPTTE